MNIEIGIKEAGKAAFVKFNDLAPNYDIFEIIILKNSVLRIDSNTDGTRVFLSSGADFTFSMQNVQTVSGHAPTDELDLFDKINTLVFNNLV